MSLALPFERERLIYAVAVGVGALAAALAVNVSPYRLLNTVVVIGVVVMLGVTLKAGKPAVLPLAGLAATIAVHFLVVPWLQDGQPATTRELWVIGVFCGSLCVGWAVANAVTGRIIPSKLNRGAVDLEAFASFVTRLGVVVAMLALGNAVRTGAGYAVASSTAVGGQALLQTAAEICLVTSFALRRKFTKAIALMFLANVILTFVEGFRGGVIAFGLFAVLWWRPEGTSSHTSRRVILGLLAVAVTFAYYQPIAQARENAAFVGGLNPVQILTHPALPSAETRKTALSRANSLQALAAGLDGTSPTLHARSVEAYLTAPLITAFVPPQLAPKKSYDDGRTLSVEVYGIPASDPTSSTVTWFGEAWLVAGWKGVLVIPLLLAALLATTMTVVRRINPPLVVPAFGILSFTALDVEHSLITLVATALRSVALLVILFGLFSLGSRRIRSRSLDRPSSRRSRIAASRRRSLGSPLI